MALGDIKNAFSDDVLRAEVSGPKQPHLTIVDFPGFTHPENKQQSAADVALVSTMVKNCMVNTRSIILAIISANFDYANQTVLKLSNEADPKGDRTLGVITKPDTLSLSSESEAGYIDLTNNKDVVFRLGWHVLKNRSFEKRACSSVERDAVEREFFAQGVWKDLRRDKVSITSLQSRMGQVLLTLIRTELPNLETGISNGLEDCRNQLAKLSKPRGTLREQKLNLATTSQKFQAICRAATDGSYSGQFFEDPDSQNSKHQRLRATIQNLNIEFARDITDRGSRWKIEEHSSFEKSRGGIGPQRGLISRP